MKVRVEDLSSTEKKLFVEVENARLINALDHAYADLSRRVKIAGFRPGKVPRRILEQRFKKDVEDDVSKKLVESAYVEAIQSHRVDAVANPSVTDIKFSQQAPLTFEATVQVKPQVEAKEYLGLKLTKVEVKVDQVQVDQQIDRLRESASRIEPVEGREVATSGDFALVDYDATAEGKPFTGSKQENITVEVIAGELAAGNLPMLEGVKVGEEKEFDYAFPADYAVEEVKGKVAHYKVRLKGIKTKIIPELNDDFAKELDAGATVDELKAKVKLDLVSHQQRKLETEQRDALVKSLVEKNAFEVPEAMVDRAIGLMLQGAFRSMAEQGLDPRRLNLDFEKLREEMRGRATTEVKGSLLLEAIAKKEKIEATDQDVDQRIEKAAEEQKVALSTLRKQFKDPQSRRNLSLRIREEKTIEFLKSQASYT